MRQPRRRRNLTELGPDLRRDLALHQLAGDQRDRLTNEIVKPTVHRLGDDIGNRHALTSGHRGVSIHVGLLEQPDEFGATVADPLGGRPTRRPLHHFYRRDPSGILAHRVFPDHAATRLTGTRCRRAIAFVS
jgi:hypothetical protein